MKMGVGRKRRTRDKRVEMRMRRRLQKRSERDFTSLLRHAICVLTAATSRRGSEIKTKLLASFQIWHPASKHTIKHGKLWDANVWLVLQKSWRLSANFHINNKVKERKHPTGLVFFPDTARMSHTLMAWHAIKAEGHYTESCHVQLKAILREGATCSWESFHEKLLRSAASHSTKSCHVQLAPCWTLKDKHCRRSSSLTFASTFFNLAILFRSCFICFVTAAFCACKAARRSFSSCSCSDKGPLLGLRPLSEAGAPAAASILQAIAATWGPKLLHEHVGQNAFQLNKRQSPLKS